LDELGIEFTLRFLERFGGIEERIKTGCVGVMDGLGLFLGAWKPKK